MAKDTFYFSHDYNSRTDIKIKRLIAKHGMRGYGIFWAIVEDLYNNANALPLDYESIAYDLREDVKIVESAVNDFSLFLISENEFGSESVERRLNERNEKSVNASKAANLRWERVRTHSEVNANALQEQSEGNAIKERKGKEKKGNKNIFICPTISEVTEYFQENGYTEAAAVKAWNYYEAGNWKDSKGDQVKNWKQKMQGVWFKPENLDKTKIKDEFSGLIGYNPELHTNPLWRHEIAPTGKAIGYFRK
jgi:uncharacterized protein YdaU (DUF1376 family)